jgi:hypothetical protein
MKVNSVMQSWFKREVMQKILFTACVVVGLISCVLQKPYVPMKSHDAVMTHDFPTKKSVFVKFGTPTSKETFENIENWYFKLSEVTNSNSIGFSSGTGKISQDPMNPLLPSENRSLITQQRQIISIRTNSTTRETYVKFWFVNDTVVKWETFGVDYSYPLIVVPNNAKEFLYYNDEDLKYVYSHEYILKEIAMGNLGLCQFKDVAKSMDLPSISDLSNVYKTDSKFKWILQRNAIVAWSSTLNSNGNVMCLNFANGEIIERAPNFVHSFVPLVKLAPTNIKP